jgi:hypothetical protein
LSESKQPQAQLPQRNHFLRRGESSISRAIKTENAFVALISINVEVNIEKLFALPDLQIFRNSRNLFSTSPCAHIEHQTRVKMLNHEFSWISTISTRFKAQSGFEILRRESKGASNNKPEARR